MKTRKFYSIFTGTGALALTLALTACTNGMMGEGTGSSNSSNSQTNNGNGGFVDQGVVSTIPTTIEMTIPQIVGMFKAHDSKCSFKVNTPGGTLTCALTSSGHGSGEHTHSSENCQVPDLPNNRNVGLLIDVEYALHNQSGLSSSVITDMITRAHSDTNIGKIPVILTLPNAPGNGQNGRKVYFQFKEMVKYINSSSSVLKNALVIYPNINASGNSGGKPPILVNTPSSLPRSATVIQRDNNDVVIVGGVNHDDQLRESITVIASNGVAIDSETHFLSAAAGRAVVITPKWSPDTKAKYSSPSNPVLTNANPLNYYLESTPGLAPQDNTALTLGRYLVVALLDNSPSVQSWPQKVEFTPGTNPWGGLMPAYDGCSFHQGSSFYNSNCSSAAQISQRETIFKNNLLAIDMIFFRSDGTISGVRLCDASYSSPEDFFTFTQLACTASRRWRIHREIEEMQSDWGGDHTFNKIQHYSVPFIGSSSYGNTTLFGAGFFGGGAHTALPSTPIVFGTSKIIVGPL